MFGGTSSRSHDIPGPAMEAWAVGTISVTPSRRGVYVAEISRGVCDGTSPSKTPPAVGSQTPDAGDSAEAKIKARIDANGSPFPRVSRSIKAVIYTTPYRERLRVMTPMLSLNCNYSEILQRALSLRRYRASNSSPNSDARIQQIT